MTDDDLRETIIAQARVMRAAQRVYFARRTPEHLAEAKRSESALDASLRALDKQATPEPVVMAEEPRFCMRPASEVARMVRVYGQEHTARMLGCEVGALDAFLREVAG